MPKLLLMLLSFAGEDFDPVPFAVAHNDQGSNFAARPRGLGFRV